MDQATKALRVEPTSELESLVGWLLSCKAHLSAAKQIQQKPKLKWELGIGLGKKTREPRTEPKLPRTDTEGTGTEEVRFLFGSMI